MRNLDSLKRNIGAPSAFAHRIATKLNTIWLRAVYPFNTFGDRVSVDYSCDIAWAGARYINLHHGVCLGRDVWLNVEGWPDDQRNKIVLGENCKIGRRSTISAKNRIELEGDVLLAPSVLIMDHNHEYLDPTVPIHVQGTTEGGQIVIERNCWLGYGSVIFCGQGQLVLGRNSVVGANSVVTRSFAPYSVVAGNPAELVKRYNPGSRAWERTNGKNGEAMSVTCVKGQHEGD